MTQQGKAEIINTRFAPEWCAGHRKQTGTQHHQSVDSNLHMFMEKPSRQVATEQNNGPLCHNVQKKLPTAFRRNGVVISTNTASEWCVDDGETHENAHQYVSGSLLRVVTECEDPLRHFHHAEDGVGVSCTGNASEWRMTHVESSETHVHRPLDQTASKSLMEALCKCTRQNLTLNSVPLRPFHRDSTRKS